jgi:uncharacterized protein (DUF488 family)
MPRTNENGTSSAAGELPPHVWTIGHSTRSEAEILALLGAHRIQAVADVRRFPGSRRQPQFNQPELRAWLAQNGIAYHWFEALGGRRKALPDSPNTAWRNLSFRGYADYMATPEFAQAFARLLELAGQLRTALMCAEMLWWRCHRSMIADALCVRGIPVTHIVDESHTKAHPYTSAARVIAGSLSYEAPSQPNLL